jgi:adenylyltransferase/sulfurtransferase
MQANEVIKYITQTGELLAGKLLMFDAQTLQSRIIKTGVATKTQITSLPETFTIAVITAHDLKRAIAEDLYQLVDVRSKEERAAFNIGGVHIPLEEIAGSPFEFHKPVVFYCASGKRSAEAVKMLSAKFPHADVRSLAGGLSNY